MYSGSFASTVWLGGGGSLPVEAYQLEQQEILQCEHLIAWQKL